LEKELFRKGGTIIQISKQAKTDDEQKWVDKIIKMALTLRKQRTIRNKENNNENK